MIYLYLFGTCFHFIYVFMIIVKKLVAYRCYREQIVRVTALSGLLSTFMPFRKLLMQKLQFPVY